MTDPETPNFVALTTPNFADLTTLAITIIEALDNYAREYDGYEYGLPTHAKDIGKEGEFGDMVTIVIGRIAQAFKLDIRYDPANTPNTNTPKE